MSLYSDVLDLLLKTTGSSDEQQLRSNMHLAAALLDRIKSADLSSGANLEAAIPVRVTDLTSKLQAQLDQINAAFDAKKNELTAELAAADDFSSAWIAWHQAIAAGLADGTFVVDEVGRQGKVVAKDPNTHAVPTEPIKKDVSSVQRQLKDLETKRDEYTKSLKGQLDILAMAAEPTVPMTAERWANTLATPVPSL